MTQTIAGRVAMLPVRYSDIDPYYAYQEGHGDRLLDASRMLSNDLVQYIERLSPYVIDVSIDGAVYCDVQDAGDVSEWLRLDTVRDEIGMWEPGDETYQFALDRVAGVR